jgi:muconolactone delta-isomerase
MKESTMQFLVISKQESPPPPEAWLALTDAVTAWAAGHRQSGAFEAVWSLAGGAGGGGLAALVKTDSLEALDAIMAEFPLRPFSNTEILPLVDLEKANERAKRALAAMAKALRPQLEPLSPCETKCIEDHPDDTEKRLNCMLKCVADGKVAVMRVLAIQ